MTMPIDRETEVPEDASAWRIKLTGLKGGHSGEDIHRGRGNAISLLLRVLEAVPEEGGLAVTLSGAISPTLHGHPAVATLVDEADIPAGIRPDYLYPDPGLKAPDPLHAALVADADEFLTVAKLRALRRRVGLVGTGHERARLRCGTGRPAPWW